MEAATFTRNALTNVSYVVNVKTPVHSAALYVSKFALLHTLTRSTSVYLAYLQQAFSNCIYASTAANYVDYCIKISLSSKHKTVNALYKILQQTIHYLKLLN